MNDKEYIKALKERDKPMPMGRYYFKSEAMKNEPPADTCGKCDQRLSAFYVFCPVCGQKIDKLNYKL